MVCVAGLPRAAFHQCAGVERTGRRGDGHSRDGCRPDTRRAPLPVPPPQGGREPPNICPTSLRDPLPTPPPQAGKGADRACGTGCGERRERAMKFTLAWLKEHLDTDEPLGKLADRLTMIGLEVESLTDNAKKLAPFSIARVISAEQHPNADRLRVCMVDTGAGEPVQVVCGAPNARAGMKGVFVPPGAFIPGKNTTLGIGNIRGVESRGMLVSEFELQISDDHEGIIELPADAPVGAN